MVTVAKMEDGKIVEIIRISDVVAFSNDKGWICICMDIGKKSSGSVKWIPAATNFVWIRSFKV